MERLRGTAACAENEDGSPASGESARATKARSVRNQDEKAHDAVRGETRSENRTTIVFTDLYPRIYGAQRSLLTLYGRLKEKGRFRLHFVYMVEGDLSRAIEQMGIPRTRIATGQLLGSFNKRLFRLSALDFPRFACEVTSFSFRLRRVLRSVGADLLHCNGDRAGLTCFAGAKLAGVPMVAHIRRDRGFGRLDRVIHRVSTEMIWVSQRVRDEFAERNGLRRIKGRVIYNGRVLPDAHAGPTREELLVEFHLPGDALIALVVASLEERKDHETLVEAVALACRREPRLYVLCAGFDPSPDRSRHRKIEEMIHGQGLEGRVLLLGHRDDVGRLMRGSDILVNPAREEALGGALIEAIGYGLPVVATDTGGTADIVPEGICGLLVPRQDARALADRMVEVLHDPDRLASFRRAARAHFEAHFQADQCAERTAAFFSEIVERSRR